MKIKITLLAACIAVAISACNNTEEKQKAEEKQQLNEVLKVHDKVMGSSEQVVTLKKRLDSLSKTTSDLNRTTELMTASKELEAADGDMEDWMHKFQADNTGKSHEQIMAYLKSERVKLLKIDTAMSAAISRAQTISK